MNSKWLSFCLTGLFAFISLAVVLSTPPDANAIPAFSRKYGTSCTTCHSDFPKLNDYDPNAPPGSSFFSPYAATRNRFTPGEQFLIHANIKTSVEYQIMPQQVVYDPVTGALIKRAFQTNSFVVGLEFVC